MSISVDKQSRGGNGTAHSMEGLNMSSTPKTEPIDKIEEVLVEGPAAAGTIVPKSEKSVEQALEDFVSQANSSFAEDYDGWDIASNIDKFVEQARSKPLAEVEPADPPAPAPAPVQAAPAPAPAAVSAPVYTTTAPDAQPPVMMHEPTPTPMLVGGGITRGMFLGGILAAGVISAGVAVAVIKFAPSQQPAAPATVVTAPAPTAQPVVQPLAQPAAPVAQPIAQP